MILIGLIVHHKYFLFELLTSCFFTALKSCVLSQAWYAAVTSTAAFQSWAWSAKKKKDMKEHRGHGERKMMQDQNTCDFF